jgi:hypothetical protein
MRKTFSKKILILFAFKHIKRTGRYIKRTVGDISKGKEREIEFVEEQDYTTQQDAKNLDIAAISMALHLYFDNQHEVEQTGFWLNRPLNYQTTWTAKNNLFKKSPIRRY